jgi:hypothetical protein
MKGFDIEKLPVKAILIVLILVEIGLISSRFSVSFSDYITWVILLISVPLSFFLAHYLRAVFGTADVQLKYSKEVYKKIDANNKTAEEVHKLMESK